MKPHRIRMTHNLILNYGLYRKMEVYVSVNSVSLSLVLELILRSSVHTRPSLRR